MNFSNFIAKIKKQAREDKQLFYPMLILFIASILSLLGAILPHVVDDVSLFGDSIIDGMNAYKYNWKYAFILTLSIFMEIYFILNRCEGGFLGFSGINILFSGYYIEAFIKGQGVFTFSIFEKGIGVSFLAFSIILNFIGLVAYLILAKIYKCKLSDYRMIGEEKLKFTNILNRIQENIRNKKNGYNIAFIGNIIIIFSMFTPFISLVGLGTPALGIHPFIGLITIAICGFAFYAIKKNRNRELQLSAVLQILLLLIFWNPFYITRAVDFVFKTTIALGFFIYLIGLILLIVGGVINYKETNKDQ